MLRSHVASVVVAATEAGVETTLAARPGRDAAVEAPREPGRPRIVTGHYRIPSIEHLANAIVAGTPAQLVAYDRALIAAGMRYFIVQCGQDAGAAPPRGGGRPPPHRPVTDPA